MQKQPHGDRLNPEETANYTALCAVFNQLVDKYADLTTAEHAPHGASAFCHEFFHEIFLPQLITEIQKLQARPTDTDSVSLSIGDAEHCIRQAFEIILLLGYEYAQHNELFECRCIENFGTRVEDELREGKW